MEPEKIIYNIYTIHIHTINIAFAGNSAEEINHTNLYTRQ